MRSIIILNYPTRYYTGGVNLVINHLKMVLLISSLYLLE